METQLGIGVCSVTYSGLHLNFHFGCIEQNGCEWGKVICEVQMEAVAVFLAEDVVLRLGW